MKLKVGSILISSPLMDDDAFLEKVILITEYNKNGAIGFILNQPFERKLNELVEFNKAKPYSIYVGGPMEKEHLYMLHNVPDAVQVGTLIYGNTYLNGNFNQAVHYINTRSDAPKHLKICIGYCGWNNLELETEIEEGSWLVTSATNEIVFTNNPSNLWQQLFKQNTL